MVERALPAGLFLVFVCAAVSSIHLPAIPAQETQGKARGSPPAAGVEDREPLLIFNTASRLYRQKAWGEAADGFNGFLARFPRHAAAPEARFALGYCLSRLGKPAEAVEQFRAALSPLPDAPWASEAFFHQGRALDALAALLPDGSAERREKLQAAAVSYGQAAELLLRAPGKAGKEKGGAVEENPIELRALAVASRGETLYRAGLYAEAAKALAPLEGDEALRGTPHYPRGLYFLALSHDAIACAAVPSGQAAQARAGSSKRAREILGRLAGPEFEKDSISEEAGFHLARLLHREGDRPEAIDAYARVAQRGGPHAAEASCQRAIALYERRQSGDFDRAAADLARFLQAHPDHPLAARARFIGALCSFDAKRYGEAARKLKPCAAEGGEFAGLAWLRLGQALLLDQKPDPLGAFEALERAASALAAEKAGANAGDSLAEALYWQGEALLAQGGVGIEKAAVLWRDFHDRRRAAGSELAEKALYQSARAFFLAGKRKECAALARRYRELYPKAKGKHFAESLELSAENGFRSKPGELPAEDVQAAPVLYMEAAALAGDPVKARRLHYLAGLALHDRGDHAAAAEALDAVYRENHERPLDGFREPELPFFLASAFLRLPEEGKGEARDAERWRRIASLFGEYLAAAKGGKHAPVALLNIGLAEVRTGDAKAARASLEAFLSSYPDHALAPQVRFELAALAQKEGDAAGASRLYRLAGDSSRDAELSVRAWIQAAALDRRLGRPAAAVEALDAALKSPAALSKAAPVVPLLAEAHFQRAMALAEAGKKADARAALAEHAGKFPASGRAGDACLELASLLLDEGDRRGAVEALEPIVQSPRETRGRDRALYLRAWCYQGASEKQKGSPREMEASYEKLIEEHPGSEYALDARLELAQHLFNRKKLPEARKSFGEALKSLEKAADDPSTRTVELLDRARFGLGFVAFEEKRFEESRGLFDRVAARDDSPLAPRALFQASRAWMESGGEERAAAGFERLLSEWRARAEDLREESYLRLGECLHKLQKYPRSEEVLRAMLDEFPKGRFRHDGLFALGFALQFEDRHDAAVEAYRKVVADSQSVVAARAQYHIGECLLEQGKPREAARAFLVVAANFDTGDGEGPFLVWVRRALLSAGMAYQAAGDREAARAQLEDLVKRFPATDEGRAGAKRLQEVKE